MVFPVGMYGCESWTIKKAERQRIDAFELWCWRRLLRVPWTTRRPNQSILKEINCEYSLEGLMLKLKLQSFGHLMWRTDSLWKTLMLGKIEGRRRRGRQRMMYGITDSMDMSLSKLRELGKDREAWPRDRKESDTTEGLNWTGRRDATRQYWCIKAGPRRVLPYSQPSISTHPSPHLAVPSLCSERWEIGQRGRWTLERLGRFKCPRNLTSQVVWLKHSPNLSPPRFLRNEWHLLGSPSYLRSGTCASSAIWKTLE